MVGGIGLKAGLGFAFGRYAADIPEAFSKGLETIEEGSKELIDLSLESLIEDQAEADRSLNTLKDALNNIAADNPIILLIDELDRCRPDFAVMMLETIKHVFDVENVQIILITNAEQLKATIKHSYGSETNSHDYLYKFFKYQINLPTSTKDPEGKSVENNVTYFRATVQASNVIPQEFKDNEFIYEIPTFLDLSKLSLRNIEQVVRCIETLVVFEDKEKSQSPVVEQVLMVFLSFVYRLSDEILKEIIAREVNAAKFYNLTSTNSFRLSQHFHEQNIITLQQLIVIVFNRYFTSDHVTLPNDHWERQNTASTLRKNLEFYQLQDSVSSLILHDYTHSFIHHYIDHTINNLILFDIVK
ncbi:hypothetical protein Psyaliredsea_30750 [Psychrobacter alimentarius]